MSIRTKIYEIIGPSAEDSHLSRAYDIGMMIVIIASIVPLAFKADNLLFEWIDRVAVIIFIIDYILRWATADLAFPKFKRKAFGVYPFTPMAIIDLVTILPSITPLNNSWRVLRVLRLFRTFRVFKLFRYSKSISRIISVFKKQKTPLLAVGTLAIGYILFSALIVFNVEPETFNTFFDAVYWATVSVTTIGYGDIYPITTVGQTITMVSAFFGIAVVALPAGIITAGYMEELRQDR